MKSYNVGLQTNVVSSYDKTKTTALGLVSQKTINTKTVLGPPLTKFIDVFTDTLGTFTPGQMFLSPNGRLFVLPSALVAGAANQIALYTFSLTTGAYVYIGKIAFNVASATAVVRSFKVDDSNTSNIRIFIGVTATVVTTGGLLLINKVALSDFTPAGFPTVYTALVNDAKAVYLLQSTVETGGANLMTTLTGGSLPFISADSSINTKFFAHNGVAATHQMYAFDYSTGPSLTSLGTSTVTAANTTGANTTFTMTGNTLAVNDTVVITSNAPTGYTVSTNTAAQQIYYVVATNFVSGSTFSLALTLGGAIVNGSTAVSTTTFVRAQGQSSNLFYGKTANLPALSGTLLLTNSENACVPTSTTNAGSDCVFMCTSTTQYLGKYTDLFSAQTGTTHGTTSITGLTSTAGLVIGQSVNGGGIPVGTVITIINSPTSITVNNAATTSATATLVFGAALWPGLVNSNVIGNGGDYLAITPVNAAYSSSCDSSIFSVNGIYCLTKKFINSVIQSSVGVSSQIYLEANNHITDQFSTSTIAALETRSGWLLASSTAVGQRGIVAMHLKSDAIFASSVIITPVLFKPNSSLVMLDTLEQLFDSTGSTVIQYRSAATAADAVFNSATGGWVTIANATDFSGTVVADYIQFQILFTLSTAPGAYAPSITTPAQIQELTYITQALTEISDNWDYSYDDSATTIPTRVGFALRTAYVGSVPTLYYRAYDTSNALLVSHNSVTNAANFQYSTDNGMTWLPLGTIPNTVGTRVRYTYTTPPGVDIRVSLRES